MRLLFVHDRFGAMGGAEANVLLTGAALKKRGHQLAILHGAPTGKSEADWRDLFPERFFIPSDAPGVAARSAIQGFQPDAVYVHKLSGLGILSALVESTQPLVRMVHDHDLYCLRSYKYFPLTRRICLRGAGPFCVFPCGAVLARSRDNGFPLSWRSYLAKRRELKLVRRFDRLLVASDYMKQELLRNGFEASRIEIHAPVPRQNGTVNQSSFNDRNRIVYAGQVIRGKGVDLLIQALTLIRVPFECIVLGDGHHRAHCERLAVKLGLADRIQFLGYIPPDQLGTFYADASLAVLSSVWPEPFGAAGLEAMHFGLPVVAFDSGGIREWLIDGDTGFLVPWMDRGRLAGKIEQLLSDKPLARRMGATGRLIARGKFDFEKYISGLESMFSRVILEKRAGPDP